MTLSRRLAISSVGLCAVVGLADASAAQTASDPIPFERIALDRPGPFPSAGANWRVVGAVEALPGERLELETEPGSGILANVARVGEGSHFRSDWEHGDLELELDFLVPAGSNSGVYLQGRYEVQILDSWGVRRPTFADAGGIYQRWDESKPEAQAGYQGHAPRVNASRAPGLWQNLKIRFRAPRFDAQGRKVENARFVRVEHNGVLVHENVEVTGPTRAAMFDDERPMGPLVLQGDHGPVAFRNIRYKRYTGERVRLADLRFRAWQGEFTGLEAATAGEPVRQGTATGISTAVAETGDKFAVAYDGFIEVPTSGTHTFELDFEWVTPDPGFTNRVVGGGRLVIGGREVLVHDGLRRSVTGRVELTAGRHPFSLTVYKNRPWIDQMRSVALWVEAPGVERHALHEVRPVSVAAPILVQPGSEPVILRGFTEHGGRVLTHAISVGDPEGVHYGFDAERGALLHAWQGPFVETTEMWHDRGERQTARPRGSVLTLSRAPVVALLASGEAPWPDSLGTAYRFRGYTLDETRRPTFQYTIGPLEIDDRIRPGEEGTSLTRELSLRAPEGTAGVYVRVANAERIREVRDGTYVIGDLGHYVVLGAGAPRAVVRRTAGREELLVPVRFRDGAARIAYSILW